MPCPRTQQASLPACSPQPPLNAERQAGKLWIPFFKVFWYDSTRGMNPRSTDCEADALTTTPSRRFWKSTSGRWQNLTFKNKKGHHEDKIMWSKFAKVQCAFAVAEVRKVTANLLQTCGFAVAEHLLQFCGIECKFAVPSSDHYFCFFSVSNNTLMLLINLE